MNNEIPQIVSFDTLKLERLDESEQITIHAPTWMGGFQTSEQASFHYWAQLSSIRPVLQLQARHLPKMPQVARDQRRVVGQGDAGD